MKERLIQWKYPFMCAWLAALAAMPLLQGGQGMGSKWFGVFAWESFGLLAGLILWCSVRGSGVVTKARAQRALAVSGSIGVVMLALTTLICTTGSTLVDVVFRLVGVSSAVAADAILDGLVELFAFTSAFLCAYCCARIGYMYSAETVVTRPVCPIVNGLSGALSSAMAFFGGTLFAAVLFWGYAPSGLDGVCPAIAWVATAGCFIVIVSMGMLALFSSEDDEAKNASAIHDRIRAMLDWAKDDTVRVLFRVFCVRVVAAWAAGACLWALASAVSVLPATVSDLVRWVLTMALLTDVLALAAVLSRIRVGPSVGCQSAMQESCSESDDAYSESSSDLPSRSASCVAACEASAMAASMPFALSTTLVASGGSDIRNEPAMSSALRSAISQKGLTDREMEAVAWVLADLTSAEAADRMGLKASTVRVYVQRAYRKLGVINYDEARRLYAMHEDDATALINDPVPSVPMCSRLTEHRTSLARFCASVAIASGIVVITLLLVPTASLGSTAWIGEGVYVGCAAALFLIAGASLVARGDAVEGEDAERTANVKSIGYVSDSDGTGRLDWAGGIPTGFLFARAVCRSRVAACAFGALTAVLGCVFAMLPGFVRSAFGIWPAITLAVTFAYVLCMAGWGSALISRFGLSTECGRSCSGTRISICVGCFASVAAALLFQVVAPWMGLATASVAAVLFAGSSVAAVSLRPIPDTPSDASLYNHLEHSVAGGKNSAPSRCFRDATLAARWFAVFCTAMGFMWSRLWKGLAMPFLGLAETLFMIVVIVILCAFFSAQTSGRSRIAVVALAVACGVLYAMGIPVAIVCASAFLPVLFVLWCCDKGLFRSSSVLWFALMFAFGAFAGFVYAAGVERNVILWQELSSIGFAWTLSFFQLAMSTVTLLALVGLGLSCKFTADEWRARIAARELENSACESRVRSYLVGRGLNPLQVDVVTGIVQGMTSAQIADALSYSAGSINTARLVAYRLLEVHNRAQLVELLARETGLADMYESIVA